MDSKERLKQLQLERRSVAAALAWPERTPFLVNPDPAQRKRLQTVGLAILVAAAVLLLRPFDGPLDSWSKSSENREMRPAMESAMKAGSGAAGTWLALHFHKDYPGLLEREADAGEPTAMFILGRILINSDHPQRFVRVDASLSAAQIKAHGLDLVRRAAAAGNQEAVKYVLIHGSL